MNNQGVFILVMLLAIYLVTDSIYQRIMVRKYISGLQEQLVERQERHNRGWNKVLDGLGILLHLAHRNNLASQYLRARTEYFAYNAEHVSSSMQPVIPPISNELAQFLKVSDSALINIFQNYPSIEAITKTPIKEIAAVTGLNTSEIEKMLSDIASS